MGALNKTWWVLVAGAPLGVAVGLYSGASLLDSLLFGPLVGVFMVFIFGLLLALLGIFISNLYYGLWRTGIGPRIFTGLRTPGYHEKRGEFHHSKGDHDRAIAEFNISFALDQGNCSAVFFYQRAKSYYANGEYVLAIADLDEAIRLVPHFEPANKLRYEVLGDLWHW